jgi:hypothetical protein
MSINPDFDMNIHLLGLLLISAFQEAGEFRRVGLFQSLQTRFRAGGDGRIHWGVLETSVKELDPQYYEAMDENGRYIITIV